MSLSSYLNILVAICLVCVHFAASSPTPTSGNVVRRTVPADTISTYTTQFFHDHVQSFPQSGNCIFYTKDMTTQAQLFSVSRGTLWSTIWDVWPCALYRESQDDSNSLRNILRKPTAANPNPDRLTYFENMSRAYAEICDDTALVMHNTTVGGQPVTEIQELTSGIWTTVELPTLKQTGNVGQTNVINVCDQIGTRCAELWRRPGFRKRDPVKTVELSERQISPIAPLPSACLTPEQLGDAFGDIEW